MKNNNKTLVIDFDSVCADSIKRLCEIYNLTFKAHKDFIPADHTKAWYWNLKNIMPLSDKQWVDEVFSMQGFFKGLEIFPNCKEVLLKLKEKHQIILCTVGNIYNIKNKFQFLIDSGMVDCFDMALPPTYFNNSDMKMDKSIMNMENCILVDDNASNLESVKHYKGCRPICFGKTYEFNEKWQGERVSNWLELEKLLEESE